MTFDKSQVRQAGRWLLFSGIGIGILAAAGFISPEVYGTDDPFGFVRQLFSLGGPILLRAICAVGVLLYVSGIENGDWLDKIGETQYGPTAVMCVALYSVLHG